MNPATTNKDLTEVRRLACEQCGAEFGCGLSETCWCAAESTRLPLPRSGGDCLCPSCLAEKRAAAHTG